MSTKVKGHLVTGTIAFIAAVAALYAWEMYTEKRDQKALEDGE